MPAAIPIAIGLSAAGIGISVMGQVKAGNAARRAAEGQAMRDEWNAEVAEGQAQDAIDRGNVEAGRMRTQVRQLIGTQRAAYAGQGVDVSSGSAADVQADTAYLGELDVQNIQANAAREAYGYRVEAEDLRYAAEVARRTGVMQQTAARWGAASTALSGTSSLLLMKYGWDRTRVASVSGNPR